MIGRLADAVTRGAEGIVQGVGEVFEPTLRLGVTGLSRSGKTVFTTSLVANLLERGRMPGLSAADRIEAAFLQPQPDDTVPRFAYERHLADMTGPAPRWPDGTRATSELRLSMRVRPTGLLGGVTGARVLHVDILDYPGEWLLDVALLDRSWDEWSAHVLARLEGWPDAAAPFLDAARAAQAAAKFDEPEAARLAALYADALQAARDAGAYDLTPGRFLLPGDLAGSPALTFAPLPPGDAPRGSLRAEMARRFEAYKRGVARPFFRDHFARIDRQVVLLDVLGALQRGPRALEEMRGAVTDILRAFRPGRAGWLASLVGLKRTDRILFAATKADHLHHAQHARLQAILDAMVRDAKSRADFAGAETKTLALASLRATTEEERAHGGATVGLVRGRLTDGRAVSLDPGALPGDPSALLAAAARGDAEWPGGAFGVEAFAPAPSTLRAGSGPPHIRLDRAAEFLLGDRL
ncbi:YcjX family protein [Jannaschia sp. Os4]|uniref:YcjX family protein n=1 Tax=Jannaschia sp. Os4 TaxID=2807617 RepID=UPI00193A4E61|nr:YcjX family protein [Jannaschia sp. Os4]MBM2577406.1 YcjX family protein [Jannaschia sp. Os4]